MTEQPLPQTLTVEQAAKALGVSRGLAYQAARDGSLPTIRLGRRLLVPRCRLEQLLAGEDLNGNAAPNGREVNP
jgi:excisionase family DNA binding protein